MVLINGVKYACERCIRGHRVTTCNHTDQPLMMIKPKGRPSTTCNHCKELRKNKNANPSGMCTCGRQEKKRLAQRAKEEARAKAKSETCKCLDKEKCLCHSKRRSRKPSIKGRPKSSGGITAGTNITPAGTPALAMLDSDFGKISKPHPLTSLTSLHSSQSLDQDFSLAGSPAMSQSLSNNNWDASSISSSLRSESRLNLLERGRVNNNLVGLDPLNDTRPITPHTRARVGEVTVPLEEYIPSDINGIGNVNDNSLLSEEMTWSMNNTGNGLLDLFTDTSSRSGINYTKLKEQLLQQKKAQDDSSGGLDAFSSPENECSNTLGSNSLLLDNRRTNTATTSNLINRSDSIRSNSSHESNQSDANKPPLRSLSSFDSASQCLQNSHKVSHQQVALPHNGNYRRGKSHFGTLQEKSSADACGLDNESVKSVEVFSLTPSFMDIPENGKSLHMNSASTNPFYHHSNTTFPRQRSASVHRNHRYEQHPTLKHSRTDSSFGGINPTMVSNFDDRISLNSLASPPNVEPNSFSNFPQTLSPKESQFTKKSVGPTSFTSELNQALAIDGIDLEDNSMFSDPANDFGINNVKSNESSSVTNSSRPSPSQSNQVFNENFSGLDNLMSGL